MSTRSSTRNLFPPLDNPELTIRRRPRVDPTLLNDFEMATNGNSDDVPPPGVGDLPVLDLRTMEELCQPTLNGRGGTFMKRRLEECYDLIENMTAHHNDWDASIQRILQINQQVKVVTHNCETCGGPHSYNDCPSIVGQTQNANDAILKIMQTNMTSSRNSNLELKNMFGQFMKMNTASSSCSRTPPSNTITKPKEDSKGITTRSGNAYQGPTIPTTSSLPKVVERKTEVTKDTPIKAPVSALKPNPKPSIPYPSRLHDQKLRDKANDQKEKIFQIFQELDFNISFADALILMPKFCPTIKSLLTNKEKLFELARTPLNDNCSAVLLKKLPEKLGDPGKFLIPCDFSRMDKCLALADLMPLSVWNKLSLLELSPTCMTLELADCLISRPVEVAEDVFVKVGTFHFLADFIVVDFDADPRVSLILRRSFLKTEHALIDVYEGELTHRVGNKAITFNLDQTSRYSANYYAMSVNRIDLIDVACEEYSQEVLGFSVSGNPTPSTEPIVSISSPTLTPFEDSDFLLEETDAFLAIDDEPISSKIDNSYYDSEGDILFLEEFLNNDPSSPPLPPQELKGDEKLPIIITKDLKDKEKTALIKVLKSHKQALAWQLPDIKGINPKFYTHKIIIEDDFKPAVQHQRRVNPKIHEVIKKEVLKLLDVGLMYFISDSPWVSLVHCAPKKGGFTLVENEENELIPTRLVTGWRICIDYRKLNDATCKDHFPLSFMDQMLERLVGNEYYYFPDGFSGYFQIPIDPQDQEKTTFTCPYEAFAYRRMPFGLCNAPGTFQRCMMSIFHDMIEKKMEVFMDDFSIFRNSFGTCLFHLDKMLKRCEDTNLCLNWEKIHFMVKEGIVFGHKILKNGIEVDKAKVDVIAKLPHPTTVKGIRNFLGHVDFYRRFIQDFLKIAWPMTRLLKKDTPFFFFKECIEAFQTLKEILTKAPILVAPDWDLPFELMFGTPHAIISDRGTHFCNDQFAKVMLKYGVTHRLATAYHPQTSGQVEVSNHGLKRIFKRIVGENRVSWSYKLDDTLWVFRTAFKTPIGCTPYKLVYGKACHLPIELEQKAYWPLKHCNYDLLTVGDHRKV
nr:reverse transcriptase domain-containing protein [Tanacetum cinerariifolium]